ncbi:MAG: RecX family transcriptional regulator [Oscillochloris sp.]|nr:RecX family transcriptional regulator [Oscillochloris sp.]
MQEDLPLEFELVDALLAEDYEGAREIAQALHQRGIDYATINVALQEYPQLEESLWELLKEVIPLSRRAAKRRAIRAAEERDWGDWEAGKQKL